MSKQLPAWVETAIDAQSADGLRPRLERDWWILEQDVLPVLAALDDREKQCVFDIVLWVGKYWQRNATALHRKAVTDAKAQLMRVAATARDLADQLVALQKLADENDIALDLPPPWLMLDTAMSKYPDWYSVTSDGDAWRRIVGMAETQSRQGPAMADLFDAFADAIEKGHGVTSIAPATLASNKADSAPLRLLLDRLRVLNVLLPNFTLPDQAIATLAAVLFDIPQPGPSADSIKMMRARLRR